MNQENLKLANANGGNEQPRRKPYSKPQIVSDEVFERAALACDKTDGGAPDCTFPPGQTINS